MIKNIIKQKYHKGGLQDEDTESLCDTIIMFKTECPDTEIVMHGLI